MENITLDLGSSELLRQSGWKLTVTFSWVVNYDNAKKPKLALTEETDANDILAPAPTAVELLNAIPVSYNQLHLRINAWEKESKRNYGVSYCNDEDSADFLTEGETLESALASMWQWLNSDTPPDSDD